MLHSSVLASMTSTVHHAWHLATCTHLTSSFADVIAQIGVMCSGMAAAGSQGNHLLSDLAFEHPCLSQIQQKACPRSLMQESYILEAPIPVNA